MHSYEWMVSTLLKVIKSASTFDDGDMIQRIALYVLDALASEVDCDDKQIFGSLGAFPVI